MKTVRIARHEGRGNKQGMPLNRRSYVRLAAVLPFLLASTPPSRAQAPLLAGLRGLRVVVNWTGGTEAETSALQADIELKLRQVGMHVATPAELAGMPDAVLDLPMLFVGVNGPGTALPVTVQLYEDVFAARDFTWNTAAFFAYAHWYADRQKDPKPITDMELKEHQVLVEAETKENRAQPLPPTRHATTWQKYGVVQCAQPESVKDIVTRYRKEYSYMNAAVLHMMDLEVQAATASAQRPASPGTVRETIKGYVDEFLNEWLAANPKQR